MTQVVCWKHASLLQSAYCLCTYLSYGAHAQHKLTIIISLCNHINCQCTLQLMLSTHRFKTRNTFWFRKFCSENFCCCLVLCLIDVSSQVTPTCKWGAGNIVCSFFFNLIISRGMLFFYDFKPFLRNGNVRAVDGKLSSSPFFQFLDNGSDSFNS